MTSLASCPYHDLAKPDCGHIGNCPLLMTEEYVVCTTLNPKQIVLVRAWVMGRTPDVDA